MDYIKSWALDMCYAAMGCALLSFLLPKGNVKKTASTLLGVFMILVMFTPLAKLVKNKDFAPRAESFSFTQYDNVSDAALAAAQTAAESSLRGLLEAGGYPVGDISVDCNIADNGVININGAQIEAPDAQGAAIKAYLEEQTGMEIEILPEKGQ
ncbi:MAG: hypothetical protein IJ766_05140 [Clostridia bacterium]|nr:hypothetical protein [Clostridia bacterium]